MIVLGLNGFAGADHDAAAAVIIGDRVVAAVEEERLNRRRHAPGDQPTLAVVEALQIAGVDAGEVDVVCHGWRPQALGMDLDEATVGETIRNALDAAGVTLRPGVPVRFVDHHVAHFYSGVPFLPPEADRTAVDGLIVDGSGESTSGACFRYAGSRLEKVWNLGLEGSLGLLYEGATAALGMRPGDEGKTMGLASYGRSQTMVAVQAPPDDRFDGPIPKLGDRAEIRGIHRAHMLRIRAALPATASFNHRSDLAMGVQHQVETRMMGYLRELSAPAPTLIMAGGVALNCTINTVVAQWCAERGATLTVPPPANDGGIAIGAAVAASADPMACTAEGAYLGRGYRTGEILDRLTALGAVPRECTPEDLARGLVERDLLFGWFEGRAEIGPRALGKRAILARTDSVRTRDRLNVVKGRESWRPLAPALLLEDFHRAFRGTPSPYMLIGADATPAAFRPLAGVVHVDNTARPQVVGGQPGDGPFVELLHALKQQTGYAAVTCTSFNPAGQPIVYTPEHAYAAAVGMGLDLLAGDGWCVPIPRR